MTEENIIRINGVVYHRSVLSDEKLRQLGLTEKEIEKLGFLKEKKNILEEEKPIRKAKSKRTRNIEQTDEEKAE